VSTVIGASFSDAERAQVEAAAGRLGLNLSRFVRQAALQASAIIEQKVSVKAPEREEPEREPELVVLDASPRRAMPSSTRSANAVVVTTMSGIPAASRS
jgi:uncharacterized protein (DUF1778 family)